jgi:hypothetical protein
MGKKEYIENLIEVKNAVKVLKRLEEQGLEQPAIASGWIRGYLTNTTPTDIDIAYMGPIHFEDAQKILLKTIQELNLENMNWDLKGIWNSGLIDTQIKSTEHNYLIHYVSSIDTVYLASDGKLYDPTGFGFEDAENLTLRLNNFLENDYIYKPVNIVYLCLEGCRRIAKLNWKPTPKSIELIKYGIPFWEKLSPDKKTYFHEKKIKAKYKPEEIPEIKKVYEEFGWGSVFNSI